MHLAMERGQYIPSGDMNQNEEVAFSGVKRRAIKNQKKFKAFNSKLGYEFQQGAFQKLDKQAHNSVNHDPRQFYRGSMLPNQWKDIFERREEIQQPYQPRQRAFSGAYGGNQSKPYQQYNNQGSSQLQATHYVQKQQMQNLGGQTQQYGYNNQGPKPASSQSHYVAKTSQYGG